MYTNENEQNDYSLLSLPLADDTFKQLAAYIYKNSGIVLNSNKQNLLANRLRKRLRELKLKTFEEYWQLLQSPSGQKKEYNELFNVVTTNETYFQRGTNHYDILSHYILPYFVKKQKRKINIWSAGCSSGEEAYDVAMTLFEFNQGFTQLKLDFSIIATDLSKEILEVAQRGEYADRKIAKLPEYLRKRYFDPIAQEDFNLPFVHEMLKVKDFMKQKISFQQHNLVSGSYHQNIDVIFCRNVMIYFDQKTQENIIQKFNSALNNDGFLFIGHSETLRIFESQLHTLRFDEGTIYGKIPLAEIKAELKENL